MRYYGYNEDTNEMVSLGEFPSLTAIKDFLHFEAKVNYLIILNQAELNELAYQLVELRNEST